MRRPLEDIRIIAIEQYGAGPFGSLHLSELGADVIKIEDPSVGGDVGRSVPPFAQDDDSLFFQTFNRGKRTLNLDLGSDAGRRVLHDLVARSDAVYSNLRGDVPEKLRIRYEDLAPYNPAIVCCSLSGYGMTGPRAAEPAYDYILQGLAGWMSLTGEPDGPPTKSGLSLVDYCGGIVAALSLLAGIHAARVQGKGMDCDVSLFDVAVSMLTYPAAWWLNEGYEVQRQRQSAHPSLVPFQNFRTTDGWIVVGCAKEKFWARLAKVIERPELENDPRFATMAARMENSEELLPLLEGVFAQSTSEEWLAKLRDAGVPSAPVNRVRDVLEDPHTLAREMVVKVAHPDGELLLPRTAVRVGNAPPNAGPGPRPNEGREEILRDLLGYSVDVVAALDEGGAFGS